MRIHNIIPLRVLVSFLLLVYSGMPYANTLNQTYGIQVGMFWMQVNTNFGAFSPVLKINRDIDGEDNLLLSKSNNTPHVGFSYRFNSKHALRLDFSRLNRQATTESLDRDYTIYLNSNPYDLKAGSELHTLLNLDIYQLIYEYTLVDEPRHSLFLLSGIHTMNIVLEFDSDVKLTPAGNNPTPANHRDLQSRYTPHCTSTQFGARYVFHWTPDVQLDTSFQWLRVALDQAKGRLFSANFGLQYHLFAGLHAKLSYQYYAINFTQSDRYAFLATKVYLSRTATGLNYSFRIV